PDFSYEWNNGYLEEKPVGDMIGFLLYDWFCLLLKLYFQSNPVARPVGLELEVEFNKRDRKPDLFIVRNDNPVPWQGPNTKYIGVPDLIVESLSPLTKKGILRDTDVKRKEYARAGVKEYFILDHRGIKTAFYRRNKKGFYQPIRASAQGVIRSQVLPGFQFCLRDFKLFPSVEIMANDRVYSSYMIPFYQKVKRQMVEEKRQKEEALRTAEAEKQRAEAEKQRAEAEKHRAEAEKHRAEAEKHRAEAEKREKEEALQRNEELKRRVEEQGRLKKEAQRRTEKKAEKIKRIMDRLRERGIDSVDVFGK
ncbi:MAG: Uma2 family endonuclease, partial [Gammaproteobacteria bacterium]|nr:Uma2 family endonuclease [Gammaproteobacteria bacterium]